MRKPCTILVRVSAEERHRYELEAARRDQSLSEHIRWLLERGNHGAELAALRDAIEASRPAVSRPIDDDPSIATETLLLLRILSNPQNLTRAHEIVRAMGLEPFKPGIGR